jgi:hypothetical protein
VQLRTNGPWGRVGKGPKRLGRAPTTVVWSFGCFGRVAEWQTRWLQVPVSFGTWGFKSPFAHQCDEVQISPAIGRGLLFDRACMRREFTEEAGAVFVR